MVSAQTVQELQRQVGERDAEIQRLRQRIAELENRPAASTPGAPSATTSQRAPTVLGPSSAIAAADTGDEEDRALERALVRQGGRLLRKGTYEIEPNFQYSHATVESSNFRRDAYSPAIAFRAGLPWDSQFDISVPYVFERRSSNTTSSRSNGIGDVFASLSHDFVTETDSVPGVIGAVGYNFATGDNTLFSNFTSPVAHGAGFDSVNVGLTATKRFDPVVYYGGYSFAHAFSGSQGGNSVDLGNSNSFRLGAILAASPFTSLRATFDTTFFEKTKFNGRGLSGTDEPSAVIGFGGSVLLPPSSLIDIAVGAGLTRTSPDFQITVAYPVRF